MFFIPFTEVKAHHFAQLFSVNVPIGSSIVVDEDERLRLVTEFQNMIKKEILQLGFEPRIRDNSSMGVKVSGVNHYTIGEYYSIR